MKKINSAIDLNKELFLAKQGTDGLRLEIWAKNIMGSDVKASEIVVDFKEFKSLLKELS